MKSKISESIEEWRDVVDLYFSSYFEISNLGRIKSKSRLVTRGGEKNRYTFLKPEKILKTRRSKSFPHRFASLIVVEDGICYSKTIYVHKAVGEAFVPRPSYDHVHIEHIDGDYENNRKENLRWITNSDLANKILKLHPENKNLLKKANIKSGFYERRRSKAWNKSHTIFYLSRSGVKIEDLARIYGCSIATISNVIKSVKAKQKISKGVKKTRSSTKRSLK